MCLLDLLKNKLSNQEVVTKAEKTYNREFKVVGVTFNSNNGVPRQKILEAIHKKRKPFNKKLDVSLEEYRFEGNPAISVNVNGL